MLVVSGEFCPTEGNNFYSLFPIILSHSKCSPGGLSRSSTCILNWRNFQIIIEELRAFRAPALSRRALEIAELSWKTVSLFIHYFALVYGCYDCPFCQLNSSTVIPWQVHEKNGNFSWLILTLKTLNAPVANLSGRSSCKFS